MSKFNVGDKVRVVEKPGMWHYRPHRAVCWSSDMAHVPGTEGIVRRVAKRTLDQKGLTYEARDTTEADTLGELVQRLPSVRQMPAIFINDQFVGGFAGLQAALTQLGL